VKRTKEKVVIGRTSDLAKRRPPTPCDQRRASSNFVIRHAMPIWKKATELAPQARIQTMQFRLSKRGCRIGFNIAPTAFGYLSPRFDGQESQLSRKTLTFRVLGQFFPRYPRRISCVADISTNWHPISGQLKRENRLFLSLGIRL
jgi:hypothetical protein